MSKSSLKEKQKVLDSIIQSLESGSKSIAEIQRSLGMKRSTLVYYLGILEAQGFLEKQRIESKATGRPTIFKLKKEKIKEILDSEKLIQDYIIKILEELKRRKEIKTEDLENILPINPGNTNKSQVDLYKSYLYLRALVRVEFSTLTEKYIKISEEGKKLLKDKSS